MNRHLASGISDSAALTLDLCKTVGIVEGRFAILRKLMVDFGDCIEIQTWVLSELRGLKQYSNEARAVMRAMR